MPQLIRLCFAGLLLLAISIESGAQRAGRRRSSGSPKPEFTLVNITRSAENTPAKKLQDHVNRMQEVINMQQPFQAASVRDEYLLDAPVAQGEDEGIADVVYLTSAKAKEPVARDEMKAASTPLDCRETNPINKQDIADAYPWISADGLRLYFSSSRKVAFSRIHISTRASVEEAFGEPTILSSHIPEGFVGAAFTPDELTMIAVRSGNFYISIRKDRSVEFPEPVKVDGIPYNFYLGPSFSPDGKEVIATTKVGNKYSIHRYLRTGPYTLTDAGKIDIKEEGEPGPGQLSKDGLSYYFSLETKTSEQLFRLTRTALGQPFEKTEALNALLPAWATSLRNILQPSVNGDGSILVFVTSASKTWTDDEIALMNLAKPVKPVVIKEVIIEKIVSNVNAYPNPFSTAFTVELSEIPSNGVMITLYDMDGKMVKQQRTNNRMTKVEPGAITAGTYLYTITTMEGKLISSGKVVKTN